MANQKPMTALNFIKNAASRKQDLKLVQDQTQGQVQSQKHEHKTKYQLEAEKQAEKELYGPTDSSKRPAKTQWISKKVIELMTDQSMIETAKQFNNKQFKLIDPEDWKSVCLFMKKKGFDVKTLPANLSEVPASLTNVHSNLAGHHARRPDGKVTRRWLYASPGKRMLVRPRESADQLMAQVSADKIQATDRLESSPPYMLGAQAGTIEYEHGRWVEVLPNVYVFGYAHEREASVVRDYLSDPAKYRYRTKEFLG